MSIDIIQIGTRWPGYELGIRGGGCNCEGYPYVVVLLLAIEELIKGIASTLTPQVMTQTSSAT